MDDVKDNKIMVLVDMTGIEADYDDVEDMVVKLGKKGTCEAFIKAHEHSEKTKMDIPEDERPTKMTKAELQEFMEADFGEEGEDDDEWDDPSRHNVKADTKSTEAEPTKLDELKADRGDLKGACRVRER